MPGRLDDLVTLPGVGRKTANVVLGNAFGVPGITVDTHFGRLARRFGWTDETDPVKVEARGRRAVPAQGLDDAVPPADLARPPLLPRAQARLRGLPLARLCPSYGEGRPTRLWPRAGQGRSVRSRCWAAYIVVFCVMVATRSLGCAGDEGAGVRVQPARTPPSTLPSEWRWVRRPSIEPCPESGRAGRTRRRASRSRAALSGPGDPVQLAGLTGRPRLVNIWASWCAPCRDEMPWLQQVHDTGEVDVLGVDAEDQAESAAALLDELDVTFPSVFDPANALAREIGVITKPTTLFVSEEGEVVFVLPGPFASYSQMRELVKTHLKVDLP